MQQNTMEWQNTQDNMKYTDLHKTTDHMRHVASLLNSESAISSVENYINNGQALGYSWSAREIQ